ncbi:hypothetical protein TCAL_12594 [Tigriopus californicus]|uniref:Citramalyl-CoA lyase, mitochondrial n=2 Tax=Tigriopus californicus TaxID=6832 RepID=A0A553NFE8_TIGCA|nr:hypothetical protein TCAL_12594 [Tigriopus californicus]|eukprot:TCALIF_12594-PA protein Name:"Similar to CLYBL Citrate lyase subunit beta-like protein, mitochondrial (Homo sapiens)" AED:0.24 eAED:0.24 QI:0/-1/0/1/-1/1/1/0/328
MSRLIRKVSFQSPVIRHVRSVGSAPPTKKYTPRRALMYVPGNDERKVAKIPKLGADCICLDCEDGVSINKKLEARTNIRRILDERSVDFGQSECSVRVNSVESGLCEEDLKAVLGGNNLPMALHLPKVDEPDQLIWFAEKLNEFLLHQGKAVSPIGLIIFIESARALMRLPEICEQASLLRTMCPIIPEALVFGSDDFVADIGATRTPEARELLYARQKLVTVAKAFQLQAIDLVHIDYKDLEGLKVQSAEGARMGFTGKQVIHPGQVSVVQAAFAPSQDRIEWATQLIKEFREHEANGHGAFTFRGSMIDMPLVKQAQNIVDMKDKL